MALYIGELPISKDAALMSRFYTKLVKLGVSALSLPVGSIDEAWIEILRSCRAIKQVGDTILATDKVFELESCTPKIDRYVEALRTVEHLGLEPIALIPSFLDLASCIVYEGSKLIETPNKASTFIHFMKSVIEEFIRIGIEKIVVRDKTINEIFSSRRPLYGYTRDFVSEAYDYLAHGVKEFAIYIPSPSIYSVEILIEIAEPKAIGLRFIQPEAVYSVLTDYIVEEVKRRDKKMLAGIVSPITQLEEATVRRIYMELLSVIPRTKMIKVIDGIDLMQHCSEPEFCISRIIEAARVLSLLEM